MVQELYKLGVTARLVKRYLNRNSEGILFLVKSFERKIVPNWGYSLEEVEDRAVDLLGEHFRNILELHRETDLKLVERDAFFQDEEIFPILMERLQQTRRLVEKELVQLAVRSWMTEYISDENLENGSVIQKNPESKIRLETALNEMLSEIYEEELDKIQLALLALSHENREILKKPEKIALTVFSALRTFAMPNGIEIKLGPQLFKISIILIEFNGEKIHTDKIAEKLGNLNADIQKYISEINKTLFGKSKEDHLFESCGEGFYRMKPKYEVITK